MRTLFVLGAVAATSILSAPARAELLSATLVVNQNATSDSSVDRHPSVAMDAMGHLIAAWSSDSDVFYSRSSDNGMSWSAAAPMATSVGSESAPTVVTDGAGVWVMAWASMIEGNIWFARSIDDGATWTVPALLNTPEEFARDVRIATDRDGSWMAVWSSQGVYGADRDLLFSRSNDGGTTWTTAAPIDANASDDSSDEVRPAITSDEAGLWIVAWTARSTGDSDIYFSRFTGTWSPALPLNANAGTDSGDDEAVDLAADGAGNWIAVWHSFEPDPWGGDGDILAARSANHGSTWSIPHAVYTFALIELGRDSEPRITTDRNGRWSLVWSREDSLTSGGAGEVDILQARTPDAGLTWIGPELINSDALGDSGDDFAPVVVTNRIGSWVVLWHSNDTLGGTAGTDFDIFAALDVEPVVVSVDAGVSIDAGTDITDAGTSTVGPSADAGNTPSADAGNTPSADAGITPSADAGNTPSADAGNTSPADAGVVNVDADAGEDRDPGTIRGSADMHDLNFFDDDGCECSSNKVSRSGSLGWFLLATAVLLLRRRRVWTLTVGLVFVTGSAYAEPHPNDQSFEVSAAAGAFVPSERHELYDSEAQKHAALGAFGLDLSLRAAFFPVAYLGAEVEGGLMPMKTITDRNAYVYTARAHAIVQIPGQITPFVLVGGGVLGLQSNRDAVGSDQDPAFHWGVGAKINLSDTISARLDARHVMTASRGPGAGNVDHFEVLGGLSFVLWRSSGAPVRLPEPSPAPAPIFEPVQFQEIIPLPVSHDLAVPQAPQPDERVQAALDRMHFSWGSAVIQPRDHETLAEAIRILTDHPKLRVQIFGHADSTGGERWNLTLSRMRARNVRDYLVQSGIDDVRVEAYGLGEDSPAASNGTREGRAVNRRIEFNVIDPEQISRSSVTGVRYDR